VLTGEPAGREHFILFGVAAEPNAARVDLSSLGGNCREDREGGRSLAAILGGSLSDLVRGFGRPEAETAPQGASRIITFQTTSQEGDAGD
jgi:hypothetical protein